MSSQSSALLSASKVDDNNRFMSGGQDAATALYVSSMAMRALPGAGAGLEVRFFLRGGWRVSILRRRLAVSDCPIRLAVLSWRDTLGVSVCRGFCWYQRDC